MFNSIGGLNSVGGPLSPNVIGGENFIRHIGNDKLIYNFKEGNGTTCIDRSREKNNGTFGAGAAAPTWRLNSLYFDGGDYVDCGNDASLDITKEITIELRIKIAVSKSFNFILSKDNGTTQRSFHLYVNSSEELSFNLWADSLKGVTPSTLVSSNNWYCITAVYNGVSQIVYINGQMVGSVNNTGLIVVSTADVIIGTDAALEASYMFNGLIDEVRILNKGLSGIECQQIYLSNKFRGNN